MNSVLQTNIFFLITAIAVVVVSAMLVVVLVYVIRILRDARHIAQVLRRETDQMEEDINGIRASIYEESLRWKQFFKFLESEIVSPVQFRCLKT